MKKHGYGVTLALCASLLSASLLSAEISFSSPDINQKNSVLFTVKANVPGNGSYETLFMKDLASGRLEQLTFYPESMESLSSGGILQVRSRFGTGRYDTRTDSFTCLTITALSTQAASPASGVSPPSRRAPTGVGRFQSSPCRPRAVGSSSTTRRRPFAVS